MVSPSEEPLADASRTDAEKTAEYSRNARLLSIGIGVTGLVTYAYLSLARHNLTAAEFGSISLLFSAVFIIVSVLYRPIEQLLARTIAERQQAGAAVRRPIELAALIQLGLALLFAAVALLMRDRIEVKLFDGDAALFWIMFWSVLAYAVSYFARGLLAGTKRIELYGLLVFVEAVSRVCFPLVVAVGLYSGSHSTQTVIALGILAAPVLSLFVVPFALSRHNRDASTVAVGTDGEDEVAAIIAEESLLDAASSSSAPEEIDFSLSKGSGFAVAALLIMLSEQTFLNAGPLIVNANGGNKVLVGLVFSVLLIARAPLQLFQSVSTNLLPHLAELYTAGDV
ncbi:MAG: hypothetical protein JHC87_05785, partial [Thermoleophilaceae bacterium]|nr:hypothetical protein [Thermoleophilaceae bacterium]